MNNVLCPERKSFYFIVNFDCKTFKLLNMVCCEQLCKSFPVAWHTVDFRGKPKEYWGVEVKTKRSKKNPQQRKDYVDTLDLVAKIMFTYKIILKSGRGSASVRSSTQCFWENLSSTPLMCYISQPFLFDNKCQRSRNWARYWRVTYYL